MRERVTEVKLEINVKDSLKIVVDKEEKICEMFKAFYVYEKKQESLQETVTMLKSQITEGEDKYKTILNDNETLQMKM